MYIRLPSSTFFNLTAEEVNIRGELLKASFEPKTISLEFISMCFRKNTKLNGYGRVGKVDEISSPKSGYCKINNYGLYSVFQAIQAQRLTGKKIFIQVVDIPNRINT